MTFQEPRPGDLPGEASAKFVGCQPRPLQVLVQRQLLLLQPLADPLQLALDLLVGGAEAVLLQVLRDQRAIDQLGQRCFAQLREGSRRQLAPAHDAGQLALHLPFGDRLAVHSGQDRRGAFRGRLGRRQTERRREQKQGSGDERRQTQTEESRRGLTRKRGVRKTRRGRRRSEHGWRHVVSGLAVAFRNGSGMSLIWNATGIWIRTAGVL